MRVISAKTLQSFWERHTDSEGPLQTWVAEANNASWLSPEEIKKRYPSASVLANDRVVFNIKGNHYRLVVKIHYKSSIVYIRFVGTHAEYDRIDAQRI